MILRRGSAFGLLAAAVLLASAGSARAQKSSPPPSPGQHETLPGTFSPDQVKAALEGFSKGGFTRELPPGLLDLFKDKFERDGKKLDEKQLKQAMEMMQANPEMRRQIEEMGKKFRDGGGKNRLTPEERQQFEKLAPQLERMLPKGGQNPFPPNGGMPPIGVPPDPGIVPKKLDPIGPKGGNPPVPMPNPMGDPPERIEPSPSKLPNPNEPNESSRDRAARAAGSLWERNIGPLDDTPAMKRALFDLVEGTEGITDSDGKSFWDNLSMESGDATSLADLIDGAALGDSWSFSKIDFSLGDWGNSGGDTGSGSSPSKDSWWKRLTGDRKPSTPSSPRTPSGSGGFNFGIPSLQGGWLPVVILAALVAIGVIAWKLRSWQARSAAARFGLGGADWPIDPRRITTREHVVIAFEFLSVLICGPAAKTWTHNTIAEVLADLATTHGETAVMLARLYELARYAPLDEPLTTAELAEARRLVCHLAGLEHE